MGVLIIIHDLSHFLWKSIKRKNRPALPVLILSDSNTVQILSMVLVHRRRFLFIHCVVKNKHTLAPFCFFHKVPFVSLPHFSFSCSRYGVSCFLSALYYFPSLKSNVPVLMTFYLAAKPVIFINTRQKLKPVSKKTIKISFT